jgi:hypothetical protein
VEAPPPSACDARDGVAVAPLRLDVPPGTPLYSFTFG